MNLLKDAKFLTAVLDAVSAIGLYIVGAYAPQYADLTKVIWGSMQPLFLAIIAAVAGYQAELRALDSRVSSLGK